MKNNSIIKRIFILLLTALLTIGFSAPAFAAETAEQKAERILSKMSTDEKIAQMMVVAMPSEKAAAVQKKHQFGGYILFGGDFAGTDSKGMKKLVRSCQRSSKVPMLMGTDEEGGTVVRASFYKRYRKSRYRSPRQVYRSGGYKGITKDTGNKDAFLRSLGLNCNFAPVADVPYRRSDFMYQRAFTTNVGGVSRFIKLSVKRMRKDDIVSVLKHFPGYGDNGDTHGRIIRDRRPRSAFVTRDLKPFEAGIQSGADMIMVSHTIVNAFDKKNPASLSPAVHEYMRKNMGFGGVIITDGLGMKGVTDFVGGDSGKAAVRAVRAGNDMLCVTTDYSRCLSAIKKAAAGGDISQKQIDDSVKRILLMKIRRGIIT